ncbi:ABC transporter substrate-binding protein [Paenibacillus sp. CF384]|uniref:ABC transporter substrate-binding protein n=1 Tax=Paenibacillus sp. CF384 TaxID=1884382 RepID=UPI00089CE0F9|nr:extracellular solute-binding protein [Paenibacillus sp. CF384]SDW56244.1 carbohydrate ABC transporter substrate-binding protein, CUT1 family [Paenibacillus sp. CF384]
MRNGNKRSLMVSAAALMVAFSVAGCGANNNTTNTTNNTASEGATNTDTAATTNETNAANTTETAPAESAGDLKGATIKIGLWWDGADPRLKEEKDRVPADDEQIALIEAAEKKYNGKIEFVKFGDYGKYVENLTTTSLAGDPFADVVVLELFWSFPGLVNKNFILPIDDMLDMSDSKYIAWMKNGGSFQGKQYGFIDSPPSPYGIFYNKKLVQQLGVEDPYELQKSGAWTWDKFRELAKAATKDQDGDGKTDVFGYIGDMKVSTEQFVYGNKGSFDKDESGNMKFSMDSANSIQGLQLVADMYNVDKSILQPAPKDGNDKAFIAGKSVMYGGFSWELGGLKDNMKDTELGYVFFPKAPNASDYTSYTPYGNMYMVSKYSKNPEIAMKIMDEISLHGKNKELAVESWKNQYTPEGLDTRTQMYDKIDYSGSYIAVPDADKLVDSVLKDITEGKVAPATAVEKIKNQFDAGIQKLQADSK